MMAVVAGVFASIPMGMSGLALVGVLAVGAEALGALFVPSLPSFRAWVDNRHARQTLNDRRQLLVAQLREQGESTALANYQHMWERVQALHTTARDKKTTITAADVDRMDALTVDFLHLSVVSASLRKRKDRTNEDHVSKRIQDLQAQLNSPALPEDEARQLHNTLLEYTEALNRSRRLAARRSALEATLLAMPDKMEEAYQLVITSPYSPNMANDMVGKLDEALARLRMAEAVAAEFADPDPLEANPPPRASASAPELARARPREQNI